MLRRSVFCSALVLAFGLPVFAQSDTPPVDTPPTTPATDVVPVPVSPEEAAEKASPQTPAMAFTPDGEVRAMWVVRDSMTSPKAVRNAVALAKKHGFNTLFVQVRGRGDAFYNSAYEPRSEELNDAPADFDPLAMAVAEGHKAGLEVHAWMNTCLVWHKSRNPYSSRHVLNQHPEWLVRNKDGKIQRTETQDCEGSFLNTALPEVREYLKNIYADVASKYDVDGIHLDYVRYPAERFSFGGADMKLFREWLAPKLSASEVAYADSKVAKGSRLAWYYLHTKEWKTWRRENLTKTVLGISQAVHAARPTAIVSAAVFPNYEVAYNDKGQAWRDWLNAGVIDAACPMSYNRSTQVAAAQIKEAVLACPGKPIIAGVGAWQVPSNSAIAKGQAFRNLGAAGINFFSYDGMTHDGRSEKYLNSVGRGLFSSRSTPRNWRRGQPVIAPKPEEKPSDAQP